MESIKKRILILTEWYLPGRNSGGPVKSIESFIYYMKDSFEIFILTTDTDLGESIPYNNIKSEEWIAGTDGSKVMYLRKSQLSVGYLKQKISEITFDFIYLNGLYNKWFTIIPLRIIRKLNWNGKTIIAPRGMLSKGAIGIKSIKKISFILLSRALGWYQNVRWHASSEIEANEIKFYFGKECDVVVAANFSKPLQNIRENVLKEKNDLKLFYLSRITPVKNLHIALDSLSSMKNISGNITYDIYGKQEDKLYVESCCKIIEKLDVKIKVNFMGEIDNQSLGEIIPNYHFLFLPTANENFGHSIFEALQCGCPVIISDRTPWRNLQQFGCGYDVEPSAEYLVPVLQTALEMNNDTHQQMRLKSKLKASHNINVANRISNALKVFS
jgi:glycosyltransferase involved in cell wall biosynthesis